MEENLTQKVKEFFANDEIKKDELSEIYKKVCRRMKIDNLDKYYRSNLKSMLSKIGGDFKNQLLNLLVASNPLTCLANTPQVLIMLK